MVTFKIIDKKTGKEPTYRVIHNIAKKGGLMTMDIDQFFIGEDGALILVDDCGNATWCDPKRFKTIVEEQKIGRWEPLDFPWFQCSACGATRDMELFLENYCPFCGTKMEVEHDGE